MAGRPREVISAAMCSDDEKLRPKGRGGLGDFPLGASHRLV
ncbi:MAG: hypothetical protein OEW93_06825 [Candidatus Bathyarchaeota archaeon]|nr:hypothetical protein [Candidatus Bathyarchaeota archaeon]